MTNSSAIRRGRASDLVQMQPWLLAAGLPTEDLTAGHMRNFLVLCNDDTPIGMIGLEPCGDAGLLRSLVVAENERSAGAGRRLVASLEADARGKAVRELWLLTIDADTWFARLGYSVRSRDDAPDAIRNTREFSVLCPDDAVLMSKPL